MKRQLFLTALPACPLVVAVRRAWAAAQVAHGNGFDGAFPGAPVS